MAAITTHYSPLFTGPGYLTLVDIWFLKTTPHIEYQDSDGDFQKLYYDDGELVTIGKQSETIYVTVDDETIWRVAYSLSTCDEDKAIWDFYNAYPIVPGAPPPAGDRRYRSFWYNLGG